MVEMAAGGAPPDIRIDRPLIGVIRVTQTGTVLFPRRVMDPSG